MSCQQSIRLDRPARYLYSRHCSRRVNQLTGILPSRLIGGLGRAGALTLIVLPYATLALEQRVGRLEPEARVPRRLGGEVARPAERDVHLLSVGRDVEPFVCVELVRRGLEGVE